MNTETPTPTETAQCWQDLATIIAADTKRVILYGPAGTGKTYAGLTIGATNGAYRLICSEEMTDADILGMWQPSNTGGLEWVEGLAIKCWRTGGRLVIDEIDKANGDVLGVLMSVTDTHASSSWQNPQTGEIVTPHADFSVVMTTNLERMSDLPMALLDRFPIQIRVNEPSRAALEMLPPTYRESARILADADEDNRASMRAFLELARLEVHTGRDVAARLIFGERGEELAQMWNLAEMAADALTAANGNAVTA